jgi:Tfp pilus assembly protein PilN
MIPNLSSDPLLNTRPVYVVAVTTLAVGLILGAINLHLYLQSSRTLAEQIAERDELQRNVNRLESELREHVVALEDVPWRGLEGRITAVNALLIEQQFSWSRLLTDLGRELPWQVRVVSVRPSADETGLNLSLETISRDRGAVLEFMDNLVESPRFHRTDPHARDRSRGRPVGGLRVSNPGRVSAPRGGAVNPKLIPWLKAYGGSGSLRSFSSSCASRCLSGRAREPWAGVAPSRTSARTSPSA